MGVVQQLPTSTRHARSSLQPRRQVANASLLLCGLQARVAPTTGCQTHSATHTARVASGKGCRHDTNLRVSLCGLFGESHEAALRWCARLHVFRELLHLGSQRSCSHGDTSTQRHSHSHTRKPSMNGGLDVGSTAGGLPISWSLSWMSCRARKDLALASARAARNAALCAASASSLARVTVSISSCSLAFAALAAAALASACLCTWSVSDVSA